MPQARPSSESGSELDQFWAGASTQGEVTVSGNDGTELSRAHTEGWPSETAAEGGEMRQDERPQLPRRRRQQHLVPQLANDDVRPDPDFTEFDAEERAERARTGLSAFQRGARDARVADPDFEP